MLMNNGIDIEVDAADAQNMISFTWNSHIIFTVSERACLFPQRDASTACMDIKLIEFMV